MKKLLLFIVWIFPVLSFSQENKIWRSPVPVPPAIRPAPDKFTARQVDKMAVLKECEKVEESNKTQLQKCLADELKHKIYDRFIEFDQVADSLQLDKAVMKLQFVLGKDGKVGQVKTMSGGNIHLTGFVEKIFEEIKETIEFRPAQVDGQSVDLVFQLPVVYERNLKNE
ncbi:MAG: hypothetical protein WCY25_00565 [Moheibacter sp.]